MWFSALKFLLQRQSSQYIKITAWGFWLPSKGSGYKSLNRKTTCQFTHYYCLPTKPWTPETPPLVRRRGLSLKSPSLPKGLVEGACLLTAKGRVTLWSFACAWPSTLKPPTVYACNSTDILIPCHLGPRDFFCPLSGLGLLIP